MKQSIVGLFSAGLIGLCMLGSCVSAPANMAASEWRVILGWNKGKG